MTDWIAVNGVWHHRRDLTRIEEALPRAARLPGLVGGEEVAA